MKDYYTEFLIKKSEDIQETAVSKVSKGHKKEEMTPFDTFDTDLSGVNARNFIPTLNTETIELINERCKLWDEAGRKTANLFKWSNASLF
jgi:hypothetical protein